VHSRLIAVTMFTPAEANHAAYNARHSQLSTLVFYRIDCLDILPKQTSKLGLYISDQ